MKPLDRLRARCVNASANDGSIGSLDPDLLIVLIDSHRTLQQQKARMQRSLEIVRDTLAHKVHEDRTSHGLHKEVSDTLISLQGGHANG